MTLPSPTCFLTKARATHIPVIFVDEATLKVWLKQQNKSTTQQVTLSPFKGKAQDCFLVTGKDGAPVSVLAGASSPASIYDAAAVSAFLRTNISAAHLKKCSFYIEDSYDDYDYLGWALGLYQFDKYKAGAKGVPQLVWDKEIDKARVVAMVESIAMLRNLINIPANDLGPAELEKAATDVATVHKAKVKVIKGKDLEKGFPLVKAVGQAATKGREPRLIDISWGKKTAPKLTIVGKGVCFDTGGLDLKPSPHMGLMKKDMGGAAHALGLAHLIMTLKLPVQLRVIIPAVENAVGGASFRPGDVFTSRSGITVENLDTDAEGRLILADALAYATEDKPDLIIDFATLTGSARAALGQDIPAVFSNNAELESLLKAVSYGVEDPVWPMPLHQGYVGLLESSIADTANHVSGTPGDLIYSALFLQKFLGENPPKWIHVDCFAWEARGRVGRAKGGKDTGLRGLFAVVESLYGA